MRHLRHHFFGDGDARVAELVHGLLDLVDEEGRQEAVDQGPEGLLSGLHGLCRVTATGRGNVQYLMAKILAGGDHK